MAELLEKKLLLEDRVKAQQNLVAFRKIFLATGVDEVYPAKFHYQWSDILLFGKRNTAIQGFRESAKTQYVLRSFPSYALAFPSTNWDYIVLIKKNTTLARNKLKEIEAEYRSNPFVNANCTGIVESSGEAFSVNVMNPEHTGTFNIRIEAYGKGASIRGLAHLDRRPKIVIVDDPQDVEDAKSETVQENDWDWFLQDVMFLGKSARIFLIGNNLGEKSIIERVFANAEDLKFDTFKMPIEDKDIPSWPEMFNKEFIDRERESYRKVGKIHIWMRERMCLATSEETQTFRKADYRYFSPMIIDNLRQSCRRWMTLDPASSPNPESCYRAFVVNYVDDKNNWFIVDVPYGRWDSAQLIDVLFDKVKQHDLREVGIEKGMFKQIIEPFIYQEMSKRMIYFNIIPIEHFKVGSKLERIKMLQPRFKAHTIWFPETAPWLGEMETELAGVTKDGIKSLYSDLMDALAMHQQLAKAPMGPSTMKELPRRAKSDYDPFKKTVERMPSNLPRHAKSYSAL